MDPQSEKIPDLHLPQPSSSEGVPPYERYEEAPVQKMEVSSPESKQDATLPAPADDAGSAQAAPVADDSGRTDGDQPQQQATSATGDDENELDKEWVNKAKLIVEQTKADPYTQSKEIGKAKADYLRIRYNKHIKVGQDQTL